MKGIKYSTDIMMGAILAASVTCLSSLSSYIWRMTLREATPPSSHGRDRKTDLQKWAWNLSEVAPCVFLMEGQHHLPFTSLFSSLALSSSPLSLSLFPFFSLMLFKCLLSCVCFLLRFLFQSLVRLYPLFVSFPLLLFCSAFFLSITFSPPPSFPS